MVLRLIAAVFLCCAKASKQMKTLTERNIYRAPTSPCRLRVFSVLEMKNPRRRNAACFRFLCMIAPTSVACFCKARMKLSLKLSVHATWQGGKFHGLSDCAMLFAQTSTLFPYSSGGGSRQHPTWAISLSAPPLLSRTSLPHLFRTKTVGKTLAEPSHPGSKVIVLDLMYVCTLLAKGGRFVDHR